MLATVVGVAEENDATRAEESHGARLGDGRDGAIRWGLFGDTTDLRRYIETSVIEI